MFYKMMIISTLLALGTNTLLAKDISKEDYIKEWNNYCQPLIKGLPKEPNNLEVTATIKLKSGATHNVLQFGTIDQPYMYAVRGAKVPNLAKTRYSHRDCGNIPFANVKKIIAPENRQKPHIVVLINGKQYEYGNYLNSPIVKIIGKHSIASKRTISYVYENRLTKKPREYKTELRQIVELTIPGSNQGK